MNALRDEIAAVLAAPVGDHRLEEIERILTDGYAEALSIEAERVRLERRLDRATRELGADDVAKVRELSVLAGMLDATGGEVTALRGLLAQLRRHAEQVRVRAAG